MTFSERAVEAAAKALRERDMAGRITVPWEKIPKGQKKKWIERGQAALTAALAVDGMALVPTWLIGQQRCPSDIRQSVSQCAKCGCSLGLYVTRRALTAASDGEVG